jgi:hypothetical protein
MKIKFKHDKKTILHILKNAGIKRKLKVIEKLDGVNERDSIRILLKILEDQSWIMREKAAYRLASYGNKVITRLHRLLSKGFWYTRASACLALGEIKNTKSAAAIAHLYLNDENPTVKKEALCALTKIAYDKPLEFLDRVHESSLSNADISLICSIVTEGNTELKRLFDEEMIHEEHV